MTVDRKGRFRPQEVATIDTPRQVCAARFHPGSDTLFAGGYDALVRRWRRTGDEYSELEPMPGHNGWVESLAFTPDGRRLFTADTWGRLTCRPADEDDPSPMWSHRNAHDGWIRSIAVATHGRTIATAGRDGVVRIWSVADGRMLQEVDFGSVDIYTVVFHPTDEVLAVGDFFGNIQLLKASDGARIRSLDASELYVEHRLQEVGGVRCLAFHPDGQSLIAAGTRPKNGSNVQGTPLLLVFDPSDGRRIHSCELGATSDVYVRDLAFHPEGFLMVVTSGNPGTGQMLLLEPTADKPFFVEKKYGNCHSVSLAESGRRFAITTTSKGSNGNGRRLDKEGNYVGNTSPIRVFEFASEEA